MRVSHQEDYDTHAVVGGREVMEFGVAQTAEFFTVLSDTLYSDKPLAVVREVLCNAWDAHIAAGRTETPIQVTIDKDRLVIRDFGHGIHPAKMHQTYCVYGYSTKQNDGLQTGGFGLGCKAPFAYSDHFTVTVHHEGVKKVYAISRGSALTKGKPDMRVMATVPTSEEGLEVFIPLKDPDDQYRFSDLAHQIARNGEMKVAINGDLVEILPISQAVNNVFLTCEPMGYNKLAVRYGNVIYPIPVHSDYTNQINRLNQILNKLTYGNWGAILQAPANKISVTPSRESLSLSEMTITTITKLLDDLLEQIDPDRPIMQKAISEHFQKTVDWVYQSARPEKLLILNNIFKEMKDSFSYPVIQNEVNITNSTQFAEQLLCAQGNSFEFHFVQRRLDALIKGGFPRSHDLKKYSKILGQSFYGARSEDFSKNLIRPLLKHLTKYEKSAPTKIYAYRSHWSYSQSSKFIQLSKYINEEVHYQLALLNPKIVVAYSKQAVTDRLGNRKNGVLIYIVSRAKGHKDGAVALFKRLGYHVEDIAAEQDREAKENARIRAGKTYAPQKRKPQGLISAKHLICHNHFDCRGHLHAMRDDNQEEERIKDPAFILKPYDLSGPDSGRFFEFGDEFGKDALDLIGPNCGVCTNQKQYDAYLAKGSKDGVIHLAETIYNEVLTNIGIRDYLVISEILEKNRYSNNVSDLNLLIQLGSQLPKIQKELQLPGSIDERSKKILRLYGYMVHRMIRFGTLSHYEEIIKNAQKAVVDFSKNTDLPALRVEKQIRENPVFSALDLGQIRIIMSKNNNPKITAFFEDIILNAFKLK